MSRFYHTLRSFALLACLALLLASVGCDEGSVVAPVEGPGGVSTEPTLYGISSTPGDPVPVVYGEEPGILEMLVMAETGGFTSNGRVSLEFPAGALTEDTYITMEMAASGLVVDFGPDGIVFNKPVTMTMRLEGTMAEDRARDTVIKWYNPDTERLEDIQNLPVEDPNEVSALLEHFSKYEAVNG